MPMEVKSYCLNCNGEDYVLSLSPDPSTLGKAAAYGALGSGSYNAYQQNTDPCKDFDWESFGKATALGATGGVLGGAAGNIGAGIKNYGQATPTITNIKYPTINWSGPIGNYRNAGAAVGATTGSAISNSGD